MSRYTTVMLGGFAMASIMGALMLWWLAMNEGSGLVGLLFIAGIVVGLAVFSGAAAEAVRHPDNDREDGLMAAPEENRNHSVIR